MMTFEEQAERFNDAIARGWSGDKSKNEELGTAFAYGQLELATNYVLDLIDTKFKSPSSQCIGYLPTDNNNQMCVTCGLDKANHSRIEDK